MGILIAIAVIVLSGWFSYFAIRLFRNQSATASWWTALSVLATIGAGLGVWLAFFFEYQPLQKLRVISFPLPTVSFVLEDDRWTGFVNPDYYVYTASAANICAAVIGCAAPVVVLFAWLRRKGHG